MSKSFRVEVVGIIVASLCLMAVPAFFAMAGGGGGGGGGDAGGYDSGGYSEGSGVSTGGYGGNYSPTAINSTMEEDGSETETSFFGSIWSFFTGLFN